ncbi:hypothetical protein [Polaromonas sp. CG9_12]|nr:hypothetical protein [Polaromonas sp. CG9_12]
MLFAKGRAAGPAPGGREGVNQPPRAFFRASSTMLTGSAPMVGTFFSYTGLTFSNIRAAQQA